ncbi:DUF4169 family protein [Rhodovastum atsumiense]|uniref:DUF4169 family protein n=1 Tax=Rhodovastum atsumiense TaxID=504468 RepID=A0A5M6IK34_9PROT|nr:DUF4169 family protein [Rhodovastum atsumiense]KAA5608219.1 DUF4169 family protein [Rhodovastum atsumiense]
MGEIVNLRQVKKRLARAQQQAEAAENRIRHGRTGAQKQADRRDAERLQRAQDGARIERDGEA